MGRTRAVDTDASADWQRSWKIARTLAEVVVVLANTAPAFAAAVLKDISTA
jgi:hypothetical protein